MLLNAFGYIRKSKKGVEVGNIFKQVLCFFYDGTSRHLRYFDELKKDKGYTSAIENSEEEMVSSHQVKLGRKTCFSFLIQTYTYMPLQFCKTVLQIYYQLAGNFSFKI